MDDDVLGLRGQRVLVIGGGGEGNGRAITRSLGRSGAAVAVVDIDAERAAEAAAEVVATGGSGFGLVADVRDAVGLDRVVAEGVERLGGLDVVVTVVGGQGMFAPWVPLTQTTDDTFDLVMDLNLRYVFRVVRAALGVFLEQDTGGTIVSIGSLSGVISAPNASVYAMAKAGLISLARTVSAENGRFGIRMNVLSCGLIMTPAGERSRTHGMTDSVPLQRAGTPSEVGDAVAFLASPRSSYISGQNINIDGGVTARAPMRLPGAHPSAAG